MYMYIHTVGSHSKLQWGRQKVRSYMYMYVGDMCVCVCGRGILMCLL